MNKNKILNLFVLFFMSGSTILFSLLLAYEFFYFHSLTSHVIEYIILNNAIGIIILFTIKGTIIIIKK